MKNKKLIPLALVLMLAVFTSGVPAYALDLGLNGNLDVKVEKNNSYGEDNRGGASLKSESEVKLNSEGSILGSIKSWIVDAGVMGQVTATTSSSITIKTSRGEVYTVATSDATVRRGDSAVNASTIVVGDNVFVVGPKNGMSIAASLIVVGKSQSDLKPTSDEKRRAYLGVITAKSDSSITILANNNTSYTVLVTANSEIWVNKNKQSNLGNLAIGDKVLIQGDISSSSSTTINARRIMSIHLPDGMIVGKITAVNGTNITILGSDNKTYTVLAADADIRAKYNRDAEVSDLKVGSTVVVKGDVNGTSVTAKSVSDESLKIGFFHRFGLFFKGVFGKR